MAWLQKNAQKRVDPQQVLAGARSIITLGVSYGVIPIQEIDEQVRSVFERHAHPIARGFTRENLHARIRGLLMMAESNDTGALLISCGNETEIALGYATLYGDMCGGVSLIGDLGKLDVYRLARHVNARHGEAKIPEETFHIKPSAELAADQYDPFDYWVVAPVVGELVERVGEPGADLRAVAGESSSHSTPTYAMMQSATSSSGELKKQHCVGGKLSRCRPRLAT